MTAPRPLMATPAMAAGAVRFTVPGDTVTASTGDVPWVVSVRVVQPDRRRPRRWRARLRAMGYSSAYCRLLADLARTDLIVHGERRRAIDCALAGGRLAGSVRDGLASIARGRPS